MLASIGKLCAIGLVRVEASGTGTRLWTASFIHLLVIEACFQMGAYLVNPLVAGYAVAVGSTVAVGGALAGLNSICALSARPLVGKISDRARKTMLLVVSALMSLVSSLGVALIPSVAMIGVCRALFGFSFAIKSTVIIAMARLVLPEDRVGAGLGYVSLAYVLANAVGPALGTELSVRCGYPFCFVLSAGFFFVACVLALSLTGRDRMRERTSSAGKVVAEKSKGFVYRPAISYAVVSGLIGYTLGSTSLLILLAMGQENAGVVTVFFVVSALTMVVSRPIAGRISDTVGFMAVFVPASFCAFGAMVLLAFGSPSLLVWAAVLFALGQCTLTVVFQSEGMRKVPPNLAGRASNTLLIGPDIGMFLGPMWGGVILQYGGPEALFGVNAAVVMVMFATVIIFRNIRKRV